MTVTRPILILVAAGAAVMGCQKDRTEIVLGMATDLSAPAPLSSVHLQVFGLPEDVPLADQPLPISGSVNNVYDLPGTYGVYSASGTADRFRVVLTATDDAGSTLVVRSAVLSLVPEKTLFARLGVVSACEGMTDCGAGETCIEGRCAPEEIDSSRLPSYTPGLENEISCAGAGDASFVDTSTKQPLPMAGATCPDNGTCQEGMCLGAVPGSFTPTKGPLPSVTSAAFEIGRPLVTLDDGTVLLTGGLGMGATPVLASAELYDPSSRSFKTTGGLAIARVYFGEAKLPDGRVLVVGGINESATALATAEIFDPAKGTFSPTATPMTVARTFPATATLRDGRVLIVGGMNQIQSYSLGTVQFFGGLDSAELYDPVGDTFTATAGNLAEGRAFAQVAALPDGDAIVTCGGAQGVNVTSFEHFSAATAAFDAVPLATLPAGATGCTPPAELADGRLLVTMSPANDVWLFDPSTALFTRTADHPTSPPAPLAAVLADGRALFAGGGTDSKQAYLFDPATGTFAFTVGELNVARGSFMSALLKTGDVLLAGVADTSAETFHPGR